MSGGGQSYQEFFVWSDCSRAPNGGDSHWEAYAHARTARVLFFAFFNTTKGKGLRACTREGMVFKWQKCTREGLFCTGFVLFINILALRSIILWVSGTFNLKIVYVCIKY